MSETFDAKKHIRVYITVFVSLAFLTVLTVSVSYLDLNLLGAVAVALLIATVKGSLVACYFMHLLSEKSLILWVLLLTAVFFIFLMAIPILTTENMPRV